jgi:hypothetical protein
MKPLRLNTANLALWLGLAILCGCQHKKPVLVMPQQAPPTAAPSPTPEAQPAAEQPAGQAEAQPTPPASSEPAKPETAQKDKPRHARKPSPRKVAPPAGNDKPGTDVARNTPLKKVVPVEKEEPAPSSGQISPGPTPADAAHDQTSTEQLLQSAESNLNGIKRQLTKDEEAIRGQIREFITQSRKATTENDLARAHILAVKAHLLSDDLVKQR